MQMIVSYHDKHRGTLIGSHNGPFAISQINSRLYIQMLQKYITENHKAKGLPEQNKSKKK